MKMAELLPLRDYPSTLNYGLELDGCVDLGPVAQSIVSFTSL